MKKQFKVGKEYYYKTYNCKMKVVNIECNVIWFESFENKVGFNISNNGYIGFSLNFMTDYLNAGKIIEL